LTVKGNYFFPAASRYVPAEIAISSLGLLTVTGPDGAVLAEEPVRLVRISARLGMLARRFEFKNGARFETNDNDGVDAMLHDAGHGRLQGWIDRIERSFKWVAVAVGVAVLSIYLFIAFGIPVTALWLANETPPWMETMVAQQSLSAMDRIMLSPTKLKPAEQAKASALFARMAKEGKRDPKSYHLLFRDGKHVGPNAFSLPDGTVVMTDQLYPLVKRDDELEGVFGHEIAHTDRHHSMQALYQAAIVPAAIALMTGDVTQIGQMATLLPGILIQSAYSRTSEQQADDDSAAMMRHIGADPAALGDLLERMEQKVCGKGGCKMPSWLGDHPDTDARAAKLRSERLPKSKP
jgi:Zn-dependent protease with chaperone function